MGLSQYILPVKYRVVYSNLCQILRLLAISMMIPALAGTLLGEFYQALIFFIISVVAFGFGLTGKAFGKSDMSGKEALVVVAFSYLFYGLMGAFAFLPEISYLDGFFESISGITTTGLTVVQPETLPDSLVFFRSYSQWLGGAGIIVLSLIILTGPSRNAFRLYTSEFGEEKLAGNIKATAVLVLTVYLILTVIGFIIYIIVGFPVFDGIIHIFSTVSTGGFSQNPDSIGQYDSSVLHLAVSLFMFLGAVGFPAYYLLRRKGAKPFFKDLQLRYLAGILFLSWIFMWSAWQWRLDALLTSLFTSMTSITTTGFTIAKESDWPTSVVLMSIILMMIGGSSGSTAGGIKIYRLIIVLKTIQRHILKALLPAESKIAIKIRGQAIEDEALKRTFSIIGLYLILAALSALCFLIYGDYPVTDTVFESVSAIGTVGLSSGLTSPNLPAFLKIVLIVDMWLGRLEILPVLVVLYPVIWYPRRLK